MMSSRSVIWTLTQQKFPTPPDEIRQELARELQDKIPKAPFDPYEYYLKDAADAVRPERLFTPDDNYGQVLRLLPATPRGGYVYSDPFLTALLNLDPRAGRRRRPGQVAVMQQISPEFVQAAIYQWVHNDDAESRAALLRESDILDRLARCGILSEETRQRLRQPPTSWSEPITPRDFCDDSKNGSDLGLDPSLRNARKVCYGVFRANFPESSLDATNPALWHERCPEFWLLSTAIPIAVREDDNYRYEAGLLVEKVNLPNVLNPFGPVALTFERTTALDKTWSFVAYKLLDQSAVKVDQGWYLVQRRSGSTNAAIMVKLIEFHRNNDWLDSVCEGGLLDGASTLLGVNQGAAGRQTVPGSIAAGQGAEQGAVLTGVLTDYLDDCVRRWDDLGKENVAKIKSGLSEFESRPLRFDWIDNVFGIVKDSTSFLSTSASNWASLVQQDLPRALDQADKSTAEKATTPAHLVAAGWKTALGIFQVGSDITRAMLQVLGPGIGKDDTALVQRLEDLVRSGRLPTVLARHGVTDVETATQAVFDTARRAQSMNELDAGLEKVLRAYTSTPPGPEERTAFAQELWDQHQFPRRRTAGS